MFEKVRRGGRQINRFICVCYSKSKRKPLEALGDRNPCVVIDRVLCSDSSSCFPSHIDRGGGSNSLAACYYPWITSGIVARSLKRHSLFTWLVLSRSALGVLPSFTMAEFKYKKSYEFKDSHKHYDPINPCQNKLLARKYEAARYEAHRKRVSLLLSRPRVLKCPSHRAI